MRANRVTEKPCDWGEALGRSAAVTGKLSASASAAMTRALCYDCMDDLLLFILFLDGSQAYLHGLRQDNVLKTVATKSF